MAALDNETLELLDRNIEIEICTPRRDGSMSSRPIWVVVVDGEAYVRSYLGRRGAWYRTVLRNGRAELEVDDRLLEVRLEPAAGEELNRRVSKAFRDKYGARSPRSTEAMVTPEVVETTLRLIG